MLLRLSFGNSEKTDSGRFKASKFNILLSYLELNVAHQKKVTGDSNFIVILVFVNACEKKSWQVYSYTLD